eukprot:7967367-Lingulodinium_polyedra.AAC.1
MAAPTFESPEINSPVEDPCGLGRLRAPTALVKTDRLDARERNESGELVQCEDGGVPPLGLGVLDNEPHANGPADRGQFGRLDGK